MLHILVRSKLWIRARRFKPSLGEMFYHSYFIPFKKITRSYWLNTKIKLSYSKLNFPDLI